MSNLFIADKTNQVHTDEIPHDISAYLQHPRVSKITVDPDGSISIDLKDVGVVAPNGIIRKAEGLHKANKTGFRGVSIRGKKYRADISEDGVQYNLGSFETMHEAIEARIKAEQEFANEDK